jgi:hypothetical protein
MKTLRLKRKVLDKKEWVKRSAQEGDYSTLITEPCLLVDDETGEIKAIYDHLDLDTDPIVKALRRVKYSVGVRARGLKSTSRIFGYRPRSEMRQDYCSSTSMAVEQPKEHELVAKLALDLEKVYAKYNPETFQRHRELSEEKVKKEWRIEHESLFTSGIINKNNPLKYHFDTGNFSDVFSMMVVFKGSVEGGYLSLPEYDIAFELPNNSLFMFDGQGILHGVTPIKYVSAFGYRFSVVYYTLKRMWQCLEIGEEVKRIRESKTLKERTRMENPLTEAERKLRDEKRLDMQNRIGKQ